MSMGERGTETKMWKGCRSQLIEVHESFGQFMSPIMVAPTTQVKDTR